MNVVVAVEGDEVVEVENEVEGREVLRRLIEYARGEADREGEVTCARYLHHALEALRRAPEMADPFPGGREFVRRFAS